MASLCGRSWESMCLTEFPTAGHKGESWQTQVLALQGSVPLLLLQWKYLFSMFPPPSSNLAWLGHLPASPSLCRVTHLSPCNTNPTLKNLGLALRPAMGWHCPTSSSSTRQSLSGSRAARCPRVSSFICATPLPCSVYLGHTSVKPENTCQRVNNELAQDPLTKPEAEV